MAATAATPTVSWACALLMNVFYSQARAAAALKQREQEGAAK
jgi:hypothetical protein